MRGTWRLVVDECGGRLADAGHAALNAGHARRDAINRVSTIRNGNTIRNGKMKRNVKMERNNTQRQIGMERRSNTPIRYETE